MAISFTFITNGADWSNWWLDADRIYKIKQDFVSNGREWNWLEVACFAFLWRYGKSLTEVEKQRWFSICFLIASWSDAVARQFRKSLNCFCGWNFYDVLILEIVGNRDTVYSEPNQLVLRSQQANRLFGSAVKCRKGKSLNSRWGRLLVTGVIARFPSAATWSWILASLNAPR